MIQDVTAFDEQTLFKVFRALIESGLTEKQALSAINQMQNVGILFRERWPSVTGDAT